MLRILFLLLAVFIGGWVAWPAYSAYQIYGGMQSADTEVLERKIDWDSMRISLRPAVASEVEKAMGSGTKGLTGALMPQIIDAALKAVVTPKGLVQVMAHGGDVSSAVSEIVSKQAGTIEGLGALAGGDDSGGVLGKLLGGGDKGGVGGILGGLLGNKKVREAAGDKVGGMMKKKEPEMADESSSPSYGLANIKRFAYTGIGALEVGVAKDAAVDTPDITAVMEFRDFDWKLTGLVPRSK
ncbi:MAG: DUF2939 domain-containing protein [bacterium]|nr:DUF2939 domain-containing protein [bacterium]